MSNTLQIGLAAAGGLVLAGLVAHNAWQARKNQPRRPDPEPQSTATVSEATSVDAALQATDTLPPGAGSDVLPKSDAPQAAIAEPTGEGAHDPLADATQKISVPTGPDRKLLLDPLLDAMATIVLDEGAVVSGEAASAAMPATRRVDTKPFAVEGRNRDSGLWEPPVAGQFYDQFQAGVQLANRSGPLNEIAFSEFTLKTQAVADAINGTPHFPEMLEEVARARELDQFASNNDARLSFVLRARQAAWSPGYLQQCAARHGFVPGVLPGRLVLPASIEGAPPLLSLEYDTQAALAEDLEQAALYEALLCLEVTHVHREEQPFARMCEVALHLAKDMDGNITDGTGQRITADTMDTIANDLEGLYNTLEQHDFAAGSALARRLFS